MCLYFNRKRPVSERFKNAHQGKKYIYAWKAVRTYHGELRSLYQREHKWQPGATTSSRGSKKRTDRENNYGEITIGIHVYLKKTWAAGRARYKRNRGKIIRVKCYLKDLVAISGAATSLSYDYEAVFHKVTLSKAEYDKALK